MELPAPPWQRPAKTASARQPLSQDVVVRTALEVLDREGFDAVTMRRVAKELDTGPASLYAHVSNKDELHALMLDRVLSEATVPEPDPERWQQQLKELIREQVRILTAHPGIARVAMAAVIPIGPHSMLQAEAMLGLMRAGGLSDRVAMFATDLISTFATAVALERSAWAAPDADHAAMAERFAQAGQYIAALPADRFPNVTRLAALATEGDGDERFEFGLQVLVSGLIAYDAAERPDPRD